jgi:hypothetical protein
MHSFVSAVIDQKLTERDAIKQLIAIKIAKEPPKEGKTMEKPNKLKQFLENREKKKQSHVVELDKSQKISCPDCGTVLHKSGDDHLKCCICYGDHMNKEIKIKKTENGVKLVFPKGFEEENIEMLKEIFNK